MHAHRGVGGDGEDEIIDLHVFRLPVILVALVANLGVFLVLAEHERASADRLLVDVLGLAFLEQLVGVFGRLDRGEAHGQVLDEGCVDTLEGELDGMVVDFFDLGDVFVHPHVGEVGEFGGVGLAERHVLVEHAVEGEQHVVGVEVAGRLEVVGGVELDTITQVEGVGQAVGRNVPAGCQPRDDLGPATFKLRKTVEDGFG
ncbi:hypothetical protein D3C85_1216090 [compost metagenome]